MRYVPIRVSGRCRSAARALAYGRARQRGLAGFAAAIPIALTLILCAGSATGHGDAQWIAEGKYTGDDDVHCCGSSDCERVPADAVRRISGGWVIAETGQIFLDGQKGFHESIDLDWWWCRVGGPDSIHRRCLFRAQSAT